MFDVLPANHIVDVSARPCRFCVHVKSGLLSAATVSPTRERHPPRSRYRHQCRFIPAKNVTMSLLKQARLSYSLHSVHLNLHEDKMQLKDAMVVNGSSSNSWRKSCRLRVNPGIGNRKCEFTGREVCLQIFESLLQPHYSTATRSHHHTCMNPSTSPNTTRCKCHRGATLARPRG